MVRSQQHLGDHHHPDQRLGRLERSHPGCPSFPSRHRHRWSTGRSQVLLLMVRSQQHLGDHHHPDQRLGLLERSQPCCPSFPSRHRHRCSTGRSQVLLLMMLGQQHLGDHHHPDQRLGRLERSHPGCPSFPSRRRSTVCQVLLLMMLGQQHLGDHHPGRLELHRQLRQVFLSWTLTKACQEPHRCRGPSGDKGHWRPCWWLSLGRFSVRGKHMMHCTQAQHFTRKHIAAKQLLDHPLGARQDPRRRVGLLTSGVQVAGDIVRRRGIEIVEEVKDLLSAPVQKAPGDCTLIGWQKVGAHGVPGRSPGGHESPWALILDLCMGLC